MKRLTLAILLLALPLSAHAQQAEPTAQDFALQANRALLSEANDRVVTLSAQVKMLEAQIAKRKAEDEAATKKPDEKAKVP